MKIAFHCTGPCGRAPTIQPFALGSRVAPLEANHPIMLRQRATTDRGMADRRLAFQLAHPGSVVRYSSLDKGMERRHCREIHIVGPEGVEHDEDQVASGSRIKLGYGRGRH